MEADGADDSAAAMAAAAAAEVKKDDDDMAPPLPPPRPPTMFHGDYGNELGEGLFDHTELEITLSGQ